MIKETSNFKHISILSNELIGSLNLQNGDYVVDCTTGGGGHSAKILEQILPDGKLLALDQDPHAIKHLKTKFADEIKKGSVILEKVVFSDLEEVSKKHGFFGQTSAIIADIGVSSHQIDTGERGFSFQQEGPLDMRMNPEEGVPTAAELVNTYPKEDLVKILYRYGEEREAPRIARAILKRREKEEIKTTTDLVELVKAALPYKKSKKNPATKTFQALRIYVNKELDELEGLLESFHGVLKPKGRFGVITFHSLEDKLVKHSFLTLSGKKLQSDLPRDIPLTQDEITRYTNVKGKVLKPFPTKPSAEEVQTNPRARSAKLRVIEKT